MHPIIFGQPSSLTAPCGQITIGQICEQDARTTPSQPEFEHFLTSLTCDQRFLVFNLQSMVNMSN